MGKFRETITYGFYQSPVGEMVIAKTEEGLCWLGFMVQGYKGDGLERMHKHFDGYTLVKDHEAVQPLGAQIIEAWRAGREKDIALDLKGTDFQKTVWSALLNIKKGEVCSYGQVANDVGRPKASRAVGSAVGSNPVSLVVPCHRVVQKTGALGNYGWGLELKQRLLEEEGARGFKSQARHA